MSFLIKTSGDIDLRNLGKIVLTGISGLKNEEAPYNTRLSEPILVQSKRAYDLHILGTVSYGGGFDRVMAFQVKDCLSTFSEEFIKELVSKRYIPDWAVFLGIESANGFDEGIAHKNLSDKRRLEAIAIGREIKKKVGNVTDVLFVHSLVDNRTVERVFEEVD